MGNGDDARRLRVAALHLRGLSPLEIQVALAQGGAAWPLETICGDLAFLEQVWATEVRRGAQQPARVLAELREARRAAWAAGDLDLVLRALKQEAELLAETPQGEPELCRLG